MMQKLKIPTWENGSEESIMSEDEWISKHCLTEQQFSALGMSGPSSSQPVDEGPGEESEQEESDPPESDED